MTVKDERAYSSGPLWRTVSLFMVYCCGLSLLFFSALDRLSITWFPLMYSPEYSLDL